MLDRRMGRECPRGRAHEAIPLAWRELALWVGLALKACVEGGPGGIGRVLVST